MADKLPLKVESGLIRQYASTDTVPSANLNLTGQYPVNYTSATGTIALNEGFIVAVARREIWLS